MPAASNATSTVSAAGTSSGAATSSAPGALRGGAPVLERVDGERDPGARGPRDLRDQEADRAAADHGDVGAEAHVAEVVGVDGDAERLEDRAGDAVERVGERVQRRGRPRHVLAQAAVAVPVAGEDHLGAEVAVAFEAALADAARQRRVDGDPPPVERSPLDDPRELVAGDDRRGQPRVADPALLEPVQVRSAQAHGLHAHQALPRPGLAHGLVGDAHVARPVQSRDRAAAHDSTSASDARGRRSRCMTSSPPRPKWSCRRL